jgi:predicted aspartyl protease
MAGMGITYVDAVVSGPSGRRAKLRLLVDSGATYSVLPTPTWQDLGLEPQGAVDFPLADGTLITRQVSECLWDYEGVRRHSPVVLGEGADEAILGVVTLENLGLVFNPFDRTLRPMRMMLA